MLPNLPSQLKLVLNDDYVFGITYWYLLSILPCFLQAVCEGGLLHQLGLLEDGPEVQGDHQHQEEVHGMQVQQMLASR